MHPATRVLIAIVTIAFMVSGGLYTLCAGVLLSLVLHWRAGLGLDARFLNMVLRMRWFFLSIMVLYMWLTPGMPLWPALGMYSPHQPGVFEGLSRCAVLIAILSLVHWLTSTTTRDQLVQGIYWLMRPARRMRFRPETLAVRLALVLEIVPVLQQELMNRAPGLRDAGRQRIAAHATELLEAVLDEANRAALVQIELGSRSRPSALEGLSLACLAIFLAWLSALPT
jgi:energy-coupling factor transporter transmembrane protein EcfT